MLHRMVRLSFLGAVLLVFVGAGCFSYVSYQTADTVPKGGFELGFGYSATSIPDIYYVDENHQTQNATGKLEGTIPNMLPDIMFRFGLGENIDMGFRLFSLGVQGDFKWRIVNTEVFSLAIAPGLFYSRPFIIFQEYGADLPIIFTFKIGQYVKIYGGVHGKISGWGLGFVDTSNSDDDLYSQFHTFGLGANIGLQVGGRRWWIRPEFGYMRHFVGFEEKCAKVDISYLTYGFGFGFIFGLPDEEQAAKIKDIEERLDRVEGKTGTDQPPPAAQPPPPDQPKADETDEIRKRADDAAEDLKKEEEKKEQQ